MEFKTKISKIEDNDVNIRGEHLSDLVKVGRFTDVIFLELSGRNPNEKESIIFEKMLISIIDHGMGTTSSLASRFVISGGNSLNVGVAGGILSIGDFHGGAIEKAMKLFNEWNGKSSAEIVDEIKSMIDNKKVLYGLGHRHYKNGDPRVAWLIEEANKCGYESKFLFMKDLIEKTFFEVKEKKLLMNVDGLIALFLCDFGFDPLLGKGIFLIGRTPGLVAQCHEEKYEKPVRRVSETEINYLE